MKAELEKLIALQNLDTTIRKLERSLEAIPQRRAEIEAEFDQRAFEIRALESRRDEAKHTRARLENEVVEQRGRVERAEDLPAAIDRALAHLPALLDVLVTTDASSADARSGLAWVPDLQPLAAWDEAERRWRGGTDENKG